MHFHHCSVGGEVVGSCEGKCMLEDPNRKLHCSVHTPPLPQVSAESAASPAEKDGSGGSSPQTGDSGTGSPPVSGENPT